MTSFELKACLGQQKAEVYELTSRFMTTRPGLPVSPLARPSASPPPPILPTPSPEDDELVALCLQCLERTRHLLAEELPVVEASGKGDAALAVDQGTFLRVGYRKGRVQRCWVGWV